jgi:hypothetical protein
MLWNAFFSKQRREEYFIPKGVPHGGEAAAGTRTVHAFGGTPAVRARPGDATDAACPGQRD